MALASRRYGDYAIAGCVCPPSFTTLVDSSSRVRLCCELHGGRGEGLRAYRFDRDTGDLEPIAKVATENPLYLAPHPFARALYAASCAMEFEGAPGGAVSAFSIDPATGELALINQRCARGIIPVYVSVTRDARFALVATRPACIALVEVSA